jgi:hypothetical protein
MIAIPGEFPLLASVKERHECWLSGAKLAVNVSGIITAILSAVLTLRYYASTRLALHPVVTARENDQAKRADYVVGIARLIMAAV